MSASDLPEARHATSHEMARVLVTYMKDAKAVRRAIKGEFKLAPTLSTINAMRRAYLANRNKAPERPFKLHEGYYPAEAADRARAASLRFLAALQAERAASAILTGRAA